MRETIEDYPALRMEDDGFLLSLKMGFADSGEELFGAFDGLGFGECVDRLVRENRGCTDAGSSLPIYVPVYSDDGEMVGSKAVPVWSGAHVGFPLYPGVAKDSVESFLYGSPRRPFQLGEGFLACDPAFRLALLVHFALDNVIIHELAVESFLLGMYEEMPFVDEHYLQTGLPSTSLASVRSSTGLSCKHLRTPDGGICVAVGDAKTDGWSIRVRGTKPKETVLRDCWQETRRRNADANSPLFTIGGEEYATAKVGKDGRVRERSGSPDVDYMVAWVDSLAARGGFPMRGSRADWVEVHRRFERDNPALVSSWTADTMRRTYNRRKRR